MWMHWMVVLQVRPPVNSIDVKGPSSFVHESLPIRARKNRNRPPRTTDHGNSPWLTASHRAREVERPIGLRPSGAVEDLKMYVCTLAMAYAGIKGEHSAQLALQSSTPRPSHNVTANLSSHAPHSTVKNPRKARRREGVPGIACASGEPAGSWGTLLWGR